jgi:type IV pilus assembly protein PilY1
MKASSHTTPRSKRFIEQVGAFAITLLATLISAPAQSTVPLPTVPLFTVSLGKPNVLFVLDNSNSMDESASGSAAGSANANSKSEIARNVLKGIVTSYTGRINLGLMSYKQNDPSASNLHDSPYDASYDPATYDSTFTGPRESATKRFQKPNPTSPGEYIYYNVDLPFYSGSNEGNGFCFSATSGFPSGPNNPYDCYNIKTGPSNAAPPGAGYSSFKFSGGFFPTDSDFAQGISSFGRILTWSFVSQTWFGNTSPGRGHLDTPIKDLDAAQAAAIDAKLDCNIPGLPGACTANGLKNAGLTPIQGTLLTAKDYFAGSLSRPDEGFTASSYPLPTSCKKNFVILLTDGLPSNDKDGNVVSDPATAIAQATSSAKALNDDGIVTYVVGFALPVGVDPATLDVVAAAGGTGAAYSATDTGTLDATLTAIFQDIENTSGSGSAVATDSTSLSTKADLFKATFTPGEWSGALESFPIVGGVLGTTASWSASIPAGGRKIRTLSAGADTAFPSPSQLAILGAGPAAYIAGNRTGEGTTYRTRSTLLGDIVDSSPVFVDQGTNKRTVYVGANDGMLHAFDADSGVEKFAYVPIGQDFTALKTLSAKTYSHKFFVDGELAVSTDAQTPGKRILVGLLGRGGKSIYGIDVTDPDNPGILWERQSTDVGFADMGNALGKPVIAALNTGVTGVIVGNGYNSTNEHSTLLVLDILTGALIADLDSGQGAAAKVGPPAVAAIPNGMATPRGWDDDRSGTVDTLYAGDLLGNVWKFDVSNNLPSKWASAFTSSGKPSPFFIAMDAASKPQPITGGLSVGLDPLTFSRWVFVGTGRYLSLTDPTDTSTQSWYGLLDDGTAVSGRSALKQRSIVVDNSTTFGKEVRAFERGVAGDMAGKRGWFVDLLPPSGTRQGERMVSGNVLVNGVLLAASIIPNNSACAAGGRGFINAIDAFKGTALSNVFFDINGDKAFDDKDKVANGTDKLSIGSVDLGVDMPTTPLIIEKLLVAGGSAGIIGTIGVANPENTGRISWRELIRD